MKQSSWHCRTFRRLLLIVWEILESYHNNCRPMVVGSPNHPHPHFSLKMHTWLHICSKMRTADNRQRTFRIVISAKQRFVPLMVGLVLGLLITSCSPSPSLPTAASLPSATPRAAGSTTTVTAKNGPAQNICVMIKPADVEAALGEPLASSEPGTATDQSPICTFTGSSKQSKVLLTIRATQNMDQDYANFQKLDPANTPISGIGDKAMNTRLGFFVAKENTLIQVLVQGTKNSPPDAAQRLAKAIADRIP